MFELADEYDVAWAVGLFEGEGTFYKGSKSQSHIRLSMTDLDVVNRFDEIVNTGIVKLDRTLPSGKNYYRWECTNVKDIREITRRFWPYLGERRRARAIELGINPSN